jgi:hypothetical protein
MLKTLSEAKNYAINRVSEIEGEELLETEKILIQSQIEELFSDKLSDVISDEEVEALQAEDLDDLE